MRVTTQVQAATRRRILDVAQALFVSKGFEATTTRDIAKAAKIAAGTMFNYFTSKEAVVGSLAVATLADARAEFARRNDGGNSLEEELFAFVALGLRKLKPLRQNLPVVLGAALRPGVAREDGECRRMQSGQLEVVAELASKHGIKDLPLVALQVYWSMYAGLLLFWADDASPRQEDTMGLLDHSMGMFVKWLLESSGQSPKPEAN